MCNRNAFLKYEWRPLNIRQIVYLATVYELSVGKKYKVKFCKNRSVYATNRPDKNREMWFISITSLADKELKFY